MKRILKIIFASFLFGVYFSLEARAGGYWGVYGGISKTSATTVVYIDYANALIGGGHYDESRFSRRADFEKSYTLGTRTGYWLGKIGLAIDAGWYHTSSENNSYWLISGYPLFSVRWPIAPTSRVPEGIIQPYLALGPSVSYVDSSADIYIKTIDNEMNKVAFRSASIELGICLQGGLAIQLSKKVGVQAEYRYTHLNFASKNYMMGLLGPVSTESLESHLDTGNYLFGLYVTYE